MHIKKYIHTPLKPWRIIVVITLVLSVFQGLPFSLLLSGIKYPWWLVIANIMMITPLVITTLSGSLLGLQSSIAMFAFIFALSAFALAGHGPAADYNPSVLILISLVDALLLALTTLYYATMKARRLLSSTSHESHTKEASALSWIGIGIAAFIIALEIFGVLINARFASTMGSLHLGAIAVIVLIAAVLRFAHEKHQKNQGNARVLYKVLYWVVIVFIAWEALSILGHHGPWWLLV